MSIRTKRNSKRSFAAVVAAALIASVLALVATPASAVTPASAATDRLQGTTRYGTAAALATAYNAAPTHVVVASGTSFADALAAAPYAAFKSAPIVLTEAAALPQATRDWFLQEAAQLTGVSIVGGTSSVSAAVEAEIKALLSTTATITRVSGADRYATAVALASVTGVFDTDDNIYLVSGESYADALSIAGLAFNDEAPILLTEGGSLNAAAKTWIVSKISTLGTGKVKIIGGTAAVSDQVVEDLINAGLTYSQVSRTAGANRYATSAAVNTMMTGSGDAAFDGAQVALVRGDDFADALAAAPFLGGKLTNGNGHHTVLVEPGSVPASAQALVTTLAQNRAGDTLNTGTSELQKVSVIGGTSAVSAAVLTAVTDLAKSTGDSTPVITCQEGLKTATFSFAETKAAQPADIDAIPATSFSLNGVPQVITGNGRTGATTGAGQMSISAQADSAPANTLNDKVTLTFHAALAAGDVIGFAGTAEAFTSKGRSLGATSCTVADDKTAPTISITATANSLGLFYFTASEPMDATSIATLVIADSGSTINDTEDTLACAAVGTSTTLFRCIISDTDTDAGGADDNGTDVIAAGDVINFDASGWAKIKDIAGNAVVSSTAVTIPATADTTVPTVSASIACVPTAAATLTFDAGTDMVLTSKAKGADMNGWKGYLVHDRGRNQPGIAIDDTAKTITITIDKYFSTAVDVSHAFAQAGITSWTATTAGAGLFAATHFAATGATSTAATSTCTVTLTQNELMENPTADLTIANGGVTIAGVAAGNVTRANQSDGKSVKYALDTASQTAKTGAAVGIVWAAPQDTSGNVVASGSSNVTIP